MPEPPHWRTRSGKPFAHGSSILRYLGRHALTLGLSLGVLATTPAHAQPLAGLGEFLCLRAAPTRHTDRSTRFTPRAGVPVRDRLLGAVRKLDLRKPLGLCLPAGAPGGTLGDPGTHFEAYGTRISRTRPAQTRPEVEADGQQVTNRFGTETLRLKSLERLLVPSAAALDPPASLSILGGVDHFTCYGAERIAGLRGAPTAPAPLIFTSALGTYTYDVRRPVRLCYPADVYGQGPTAPTHPTALACYRAKLSRTKPPQSNPLPRRVATANQLGDELLTMNAIGDLCVPSEVVGVDATPTPQRTATPTPAPTITPPPGFTLRVGPASATVNIGERARFTATAIFLNGDTEDFTERVLWRSSTEVARAVEGERGRFDTVDGGATVISALDPLTGVSSTDSGDDAILNVTWTLQRLELLPTTASRGQGESIRLRATGHFAGGFTRSIADRLVYTSSDVETALPINSTAPIDRSKVIAIDQGVATISAVDPLSGVTSTASGDNVTLTVLEPLARCEILQSSIGLSTDTFFQFTAHGFYPGGFQRVLTQQVVWSSDDPSVVEAPNTEGDRSRVLAIAPGVAHITATDSITGLKCKKTATVTVATPYGLWLYPAGDPKNFSALRVGRSWHAVAAQLFPYPIERKYVTEKVVFTSSDPAIVAAPNVAGDRGRLDAVGSGTAMISATDPVTGLESQSVYLRSLDGLTRVEIEQRIPGLPAIVSVGTTLYVTAAGYFADGYARFETSDVTFVASDPTVIEPYVDGINQWRLRALAPGVTTISAVDKLTGISSDAWGGSLRIGVRGALERIELVPEHVTRRMGEIQAFTAIAHYVGGASEVVTQDLVYSSSAPAIAAAKNDYFVRSRVDALAGGEATITAQDPVSGISSANSGGDATLTVVGPLQQLRVQPTSVSRSLGRSFSFTAIGRDAAGREINLTQDVQWSSSNPSVAEAPNAEGNRSRIDSRGLGGTIISAFDAQDGVSSGASDDNATFLVEGTLASLTLSAETTEIVVGQTVQLTATGHLADASTINLTQQVDYSSSDPAVALADNTVGDRSRITAAAPGTTVISARDPGTGIVTAPGGTVTITVTAP